MSSAPAAVIAAGFLVLAGAIAGFVLGRWSVSPSAMGPIEFTDPVGADAPDLGPLLTEIRQGHDEILRALRERPTQLIEVPGREAAVPVVPEDRIARLAVAIEELNERLGANRGPGYASLALLQEEIRIRMKMFEAGFAPEGVLLSELKTAHANWTQANLIARYGTPMSLGEENGVRVVAYPLGDWNGLQFGRVEFRLADDRTTDVRIEPTPR